ncbi:MAG TPA: PfkB family carbohydrate kinase [Myxococcales bacterium]|nr:PfkB family carbohydrate kinase [Myxococcales bacterium]
MILVAGHYCHDTLIGNAGSARALGGSAAYASAVLDALGEPHQVVAKVGADFLYAAQVSHPPAVVAGRTTAFVDDDRAAERRQWVEAAAPPIEPSDLQGRFDLGIACAVAGELPLRTLLRMRELCGILVADAQALLRSISRSGELTLRPADPAALETLDCLKASRQEAALIDVQALRRRMTVLVTDGARGCDVLGRDLEVHVAAFPAQEKDPTGAGDRFLAGFAAALLRGNDPVAAARLGAYCGARAVEQVGVPRLTPAQAREARALAG